MAYHVIEHGEKPSVFLSLRHTAKEICFSNFLPPKSKWKFQDHLFTQHCNKWLARVRLSLTFSITPAPSLSIALSFLSGSSGSNVIPLVFSIDSGTVTITCMRW